MKLVVTGLLAALLCACQNGSHNEEKCCSGKTFEEVELPYSVTVSKDDHAVGVLVVDTDLAASFTAAEGATAAHVASVEAKIAKTTKAGKVTYIYSDFAGDTHCKCGGEVPVSSKQYPGALKAALHGEYFDVSD